MPKFGKIDDVEIVAALLAGDSSKVSAHAGEVSEPDTQNKAGYEFWASFCEVINEDRTAEMELRDGLIRRVLNELPRIRSQRTNALLTESNYASSFASEKLAYFRPHTFKVASALASALLVIGASMGVYFMDGNPGAGVDVAHKGDESTVLSQSVQGLSSTPNDSATAVHSDGVEGGLTLAARISQIEPGETLVLEGAFRETLRITKPLRLTATKAGGVRIGL